MLCIIWMTHPEYRPVHNLTLNTLNIPCININNFWMLTLNTSFCVSYFFWDPWFVFDCTYHGRKLQTQTVWQNDFGELLQMSSRRYQQSSCNNYYHLFHYQNVLLRSQHQKIDFTHSGHGYSSKYAFVFLFFFFFFLNCLFLFSFFWLCLQFLLKSTWVLIS